MAATGAPAVTVLVVPGPADIAGGHAELAELLGHDRLARLQSLLLTRLVAWSRQAAGDHVTVLESPAGEGLADAVERAFAGAPRPVVVAWADLPVWRAEHAAGVRDDLADGCDVSVGPVFDGGFYLLALARPVPDLLNASGDAWTSPESMGAILGAAHEAGLSTGLLRPERGLRGAADVRAALADPLLDSELRAVLDGE